MSTAPKSLHGQHLTPGRIGRQWWDRMVDLYGGGRGADDRQKGRDPQLSKPSACLRCGWRRSKDGRCRRVAGRPFIEALGRGATFSGRFVGWTEGMQIVPRHMPLLSRLDRSTASLRSSPNIPLRLRSPGGQEAAARPPGYGPHRGSFEGRDPPLAVASGYVWADPEIVPVDGQLERVTLPRWRRDLAPHLQRLIQVGMIPTRARSFESRRTRGFRRAIFYAPGGRPTERLPAIAVALLFRNWLASEIRIKISTLGNPYSSGGGWGGGGGPPPGSGAGNRVRFRPDDSGRPPDFLDLGAARGRGGTDPAAPGERTQALRRSRTAAYLRRRRQPGLTQSLNPGRPRRRGDRRAWLARAREPDPGLGRLTAATTTWVSPTRCRPRIRGHGRTRGAAADPAGGALSSLPADGRQQALLGASRPAMAAWCKALHWAARRQRQETGKGNPRPPAAPQKVLDDPFRNGQAACAQTPGTRACRRCGEWMAGVPRAAARGRGRKPADAP